MMVPILEHSTTLSQIMYQKKITKSKETLPSYNLLVKKKKNPARLSNFHQNQPGHYQKEVQITKLLLLLTSNRDNISILVPMGSSHQLVEDQLVDMFVAKLVLPLMVSLNLNQLLPTNTLITTHHLMSTMLEICSLGALGHQENKLLLLPLLNNNSAILVNVERKMPRV